MFPAHRLLAAIAALAAPLAISACDDACISGITNAFLSNYTTPINTVFQSMADQINALLPAASRSDNPMDFLEPILDVYSLRAYDRMRTAIFTQHFYGKCQLNGVVPPGCPKPDCPVVCGAPGSLVHFYATLSEIAFNETRAVLEDAARPGSHGYAKVERAVMMAAGRRTGPRDINMAAGEESVETRLRGIVDGVGGMLGEACAAAGTETTLVRCSWEAQMKAFILSYP